MQIPKQVIRSANEKFFESRIVVFEIVSAAITLLLTLKIRNVRAEKIL